MTDTHAFTFFGPPTPASRLRGRHVSTRGFTLIEVLIVIGIIGLLVGLAVIGFNVVGGSAKNRLTVGTFETCKNLVASYKETTAIERLLDSGTSTSTMYKITVSGGPMRWSTSDLTGSTTAATEADLVNACAIAPGIKTNGTSAETDPDVRAVRERFLRDETARVIKRFSAVPASKKTLESLSSDRLIQLRVPTDPATSLATAMGIPPEYPTTVNTFQGVVFRDGYGNPIYFIPGGGLRGVNLGYKGKGSKADTANYDNPTQLVRAPDKQPFWASPGPDGDLTTGDDNVYSFEN